MLPWFTSDEKDISNVVAQCRWYSMTSCRGLCLKDLNKISQMSVAQCRQYSTINCCGLCLNYLKKISQTWWSSVGSILQ